MKNLTKMEYSCSKYIKNFQESPNNDQNRCLLQTSYNLKHQTMNKLTLQKDY